MGIELIGHEYPGRVRIGLDSRFKVGGEIRRSPRPPERRAEDFSGDDIEVRDQTQGTVAAIFELSTLH